MDGYLDIHSHILPGVDDGSKSMEMSMRMLKLAYEEGIRCMVATPHYYPGHKNWDSEQIKIRFEQMQAEAVQYFPDMTLMLGNEIYYKNEVLTRLEHKEILTLNNSRYILVEFPVGLEYSQMYHAVKQLTLKGFYPIIAHVERYAALYKKAQLVEELIQTGAYIQVNADTFLGNVLDGRKRYSMKLLSEGMVHFLGSDAHDENARKPVMEQAVSLLRRKVDGDILEKVLVHNPIFFRNNSCIK